MSARSPHLILVLLALGSCQQCPSESPPPGQTTTTPAAPADQGSRASKESSASDASLELLGGERGLDHLNIATADLAVARQAFQRLGFGRGTPGRMKNGLENINYYFEDATFLEALTCYDCARAAWVGEFLKRGSGPMKLVLSIRSAAETAAFLAKRGLKTSPPISGSIAVKEGGEPVASWHKLLLSESPLPGDSVFFIAHEPVARRQFLQQLERPEIRRRHFQYPNTAQGIAAAWMAVADLEAASQIFARLGLGAEKTELSDPRLAARVRLIRVGQGEVRLLAAAGEGPVASHLAQRGEGLIGLTIKVASLKTARELIAQGCGLELERYEGRLGPSVLVPPSSAQGAWLELSEQL